MGARALARQVARSNRKGSARGARSLAIRRRRGAKHSRRPAHRMARSLAPRKRVLSASREHWERQAGNWAAWARTPNFDAYWDYSLALGPNSALPDVARRQNRLATIPYFL